jgi:hypothetical protein
MTTKRTVVVLTVILLSLGLVSCERTKIGDITADPGSFTNKEVNVAGTVTNSMGALIAGAYEIDDGTGKLWVVSDGTGKLWVVSEKRGVPSKGAHVGVKGRIVPTLTFMGRNFATVMRESDRRAEKAK